MQGISSDQIVSPSGVISTAESSFEFGTLEEPVRVTIVCVMIGG